MNMGELLTLLGVVLGLIGGAVTVTVWLLSKINGLGGKIEKNAMIALEHDMEIKTEVYKDYETKQDAARQVEALHGRMKQLSQTVDNRFDRFESKLDTILDRQANAGRS